MHTIPYHTILLILLLFATIVVGRKSLRIGGEYEQEEEEEERRREVPPRLVAKAAGMLSYMAAAYTQFEEGGVSEIKFKDIDPLSACSLYLSTEYPPPNPEFKSCSASITIDGELFIRCTVG